MGGGGSKAQTTNTVAEPWAEQKPFLTKGFSEADRIYNKGAPSYFPGQTVAQPSDVTNLAQNATINRALSGNAAENAGERSLINTLQGQFLGGGPGNNLINSAANQRMPGIAFGAQQAMGLTPEQMRLSQMGVTGPQQAGNSTFGGIASGTNNQIGSLNDIAAGNQVLSNPYLDSTFKQAADRVTSQFQNTVAPQRDASAVAAGRYGSGTYNRIRQQDEQNLQENLNNLATNIYGGAYDTERNRQMSALTSSLQNQQSAAGALNQSGLGVNQAQLSALESALQGRQFGAGLAQTASQQQQAGQLAAGQALNQQFQNERGNQMDAAKTALGYGQQDFTDLAALQGVGAERDALNQANINSQIDRYNYEQNAEYNNLLNYLGAIQGNYGGSSTTTGTQPGGNKFIGGLGGAATGASIGSFFGPVGTAVGGGLGLLGGLFG